jgi:hypothetical protein
LEVENHMAAYIVKAASDPERAADMHDKWLLDKSDKVDQIPFRNEAELFAPFYCKNKKRLDEDMKKSAPADIRLKSVTRQDYIK